MISRFSSKYFVLLALILSIGARLYWIPQKAGLYLDESLSIILSECKNPWAFTKLFDENKMYTGEEIRNIAWGTSSSFSDALSDVKQLHIDVNDSPHTNLYYSILRLCLTGTDCSLRDVINRGCYLNMFFWLFSFFFLYKLLKRLFDDDLVIAVTLLVTFISTASLSNAMFMRTYCLQETLFIILTYVFVCNYQSIDEQSKKYNWKDVLPLSLLCSFVLLSGYLAIAYVLMLIGVLAIISWMKDQKRNTVFLMASFVLSLLLANVFYLKYLEGFSAGSYMAVKCYNILLNYKDFLLDSLKSTAKVLEYVFMYLLSPFAITFIAVYLLSFQKIRWENFIRNDRIATIVFACCLLWSVSSFFEIPYGNCRYIMSVSPMLALIVAIIIDGVRDSKLRIAAIVFACGLLWSFASFIVIPYKEYRYIMSASPMLALIVPIVINRVHNSKIRTIIIAITASAYTAVAFNPLEPNGHLIKQKIEYMYAGEKYPFHDKPRIPVLIYCNANEWNITQAIAFFDDSPKYQFVKSYDSLIENLSKYNHVFIMMEFFEELAVPGNYKTTFFQNFNNDWFIYSYELELKNETSPTS
ncbi:hypothetical protein FACS189449_01520 [Alphaproteobacteria bacterium]|nr:hypothetical protein FACS189449_01520 [Alphaproteobacteria bacterium]